MNRPFVAIGQFDPVIGLHAPEAAWVPSPAHVLRRAAILDSIAGLPAGRVLEIGCGSGVFLYDLAIRGYSGKGVDSSPHAMTLARRFWPDNAGPFTVSARLDPHDTAQYDYLMSFEVLEHIEDDRSVLADWLGYLKPGGRIVVSVPAHQSLYGASDRWAGHVRRYDRDQLVKLLEDCSCSVDRVVCYGFPLLNLLAPISNSLAKRKISMRNSPGRTVDLQEATFLSGVDRSVETRLFPLYAKLPGILALQAACALQRRFYGSNLGTGFLAIAELRAASTGRSNGSRSSS